MSTTPETTQEPESELGQLVKPVQPYIEKYGSKVVLGLAAVLLLAAVYIFWQRSANAASAAGWSEFSSASAPEDYEDIADQYTGSAAAAWARLAAANGHFSSGVQMSFTSRTASKSSFDKAQSAFKKLLDNRSTPKEVRERALYGMAKLEEATSGSDTSAAIAAYEKLLGDFPNSTYKAVAEERIEALKDPEVQKFYGWFQEQDPSVTDPLRMPNDPGSLPLSPGKPEDGLGSLDSLLKSDPPSSPEASGEPAAPELPGPPQEGESKEDGAEEAKANEAAAEDDGSEDK